MAATELRPAEARTVERLAERPGWSEHRSTMTSAADEAWFRTVFTEGYTPLVAYARRRVGPSEADDIVADVFTTAWRRRGETDRSTPIMPWLYGIAANVTRNQWRSSGRRLRLVDKIGSEIRSPDRSFDLPTIDDDSGVRQALGQLSYDDQEILRLIAWEELTHAEIGEVLGCSTNAVGIRLHRARKRLKKALEASDQGAGASPGNEEGST